MEKLDFLTVTDRARRDVSTFAGMAGAVREATDLINEKAHLTAAGLQYIEPITQDGRKCTPYVRCMDGHGDILRVDIHYRGSDEEGRTVFQLDYYRLALDDSRLAVMRLGRDPETSKQ